MGETEAVGNARFRRIPGTIRELLRRLIERKVTIVLDAEMQPERVEIEAVVGDLLVAEEIRRPREEEKNHNDPEERRRIKFVDIECICEVIVDREELLEAIFGLEFEEEEEREKKHKEEKLKRPPSTQSSFSY